MFRFATFRHDLFNAITHLFGYDVCIVDADLCVNRFKFVLAPPPLAAGCEFRFLRHHLTGSTVGRATLRSRVEP